MKKHFSVREGELRKKLIEGTVNHEDLAEAEDLALETRNIQHRSLYAQIKRDLANVAATAESEEQTENEKGDEE